MSPGKTGFGLLLFSLLIARAEQPCPWLNAATAGGALGSPITAVRVTRAKSGDDASCLFESRNGSAVSELRVDTETMPPPAKGFASLGTTCLSKGVPLKGIGSSAIACSGRGGDGIAEQIVGRVRDRAFLVRVSSTDPSEKPGVLRETARKVAELVAASLF